jgi:hypothetical protein
MIGQNLSMTSFFFLLRVGIASVHFTFALVGLAYPEARVHPQSINFPYTSCLLGLLATSQQYFSLKKNQPPANTQQYFSLTINQHQPSAKR